MTKKKIKPRNAELAIIIKNDPKRISTKVREGKKRKEKLKRSVRKQKEKKYIEEHKL